jgi:hypothetical protein
MPLALLEFKSPPRTLGDFWSPGTSMPAPETPMKRETPACCMTGVSAAAVSRCRVWSLFTGPSAETTASTPVTSSVNAASSRLVPATTRHGAGHVSCFPRGRLAYETGGPGSRLASTSQRGRVSTPTRGLHRDRRGEHRAGAELPDRGRLPGGQGLLRSPRLLGDAGRGIGPGLCGGPARVVARSLAGAQRADHLVTVAIVDRRNGTDAAHHLIRCARALRGPDQREDRIKGAQRRTE